MPALYCLQSHGKGEAKKRMEPRNGLIVQHPAQIHQGVLSTLPHSAASSLAKHTHKKYL
jgi:hypothetical protein